MSTQFQHCPKCRTRNFSDDKVCGICKSKLTNIISKDSKFTPQPFSFKRILLVVLGILFLYFAFTDSKSDTELSEGVYSESVLQNSPELQLAFINDSSSSPKRVTISLFSMLLISLNEVYSKNTKQELANVLVAGHNIIIKQEHKDSLLEFTSAFETYITKTHSKLKLPIEDALALFIKISYET